jgi:YD repeat-containing protein
MWPVNLSGMNSGLFGVNWRSTYEERVFYGDDGTVKYSRADGSLWSFLFYGNPPTYQVIAPANGRATLAQGASQWTLTFDNGEKRLFDNASGSLVAIVDRNGNTTQVSYDATNRLVAVADPASRHLYFAYGSTSSRLVTGITSDLGLSLAYLYDSQGRLIKVTKPDQTTLSF